MINKASLSMMKDGVVILNFARDLLVNDDDMAEALDSGKVRKYVTDFPNAKTANMEANRKRTSFPEKSRFREV